MWVRWPGEHSKGQPAQTDRPLCGQNLLGPLAEGGTERLVCNWLLHPTANRPLLPPQEAFAYPTLPQTTPTVDALSCVLAYPPFTLPPGSSAVVSV